MTTETESAYIIANPSAGRTRRKTVCQFGLQGAPCIWEETRFPGHGESLAHEASVRGFRWIIAMGGDGTIHEILNGMLGNPANRSILGILPAGTANDYAAAFARQPGGAPQPTPLSVDVGRLRWEGGARYFANVAGLGFSGRIADRARDLTRIPARWRYTLALLQQLGRSYRPSRWQLAVDDGPISDTESLFLSAAIGKREGSYPLHGQADLSDGKFELLRIGRLRRLEMAWHFPAMLRGILPQEHPHLFQSQCHRIHVEASEPIPIHLDGEYPKGASPDALVHLDLEVVPLAIRVQMFDVKSSVAESSSPVASSPRMDNNR